jgi:HisJ family histidinol phosphate phosphatase
VICDNHNHFVMSGGDIAAMVAAAEDAGLDEMAFCEHVYHLQEAREAIPYLTTMRPEGEILRVDDYLRTVHEAASGATSTRVRLGIELDSRPDDPRFEDDVHAFCEEHADAWDVVLGSVHVIAGDHNVHRTPPGISAEEAWDDYLGRVLETTASGRFDVISHPVRLGVSFPGIPEGVPALLDEVAGTAAAAGVALEVNGNDVRKRDDLVRILVDACVRHGTPVSLGSDAHYPNSVGRVRAALPLLEDAGVREVASFDRRGMTMVPLA